MASSIGSDQNITGKNIILCFDGTDNTFGPNPFSNVLKLYRMLDNSNTETQLCYYQPGIGTSLEYDTDFGWKGWLSWKKLKMTVDSLIAYSLDHHIITAYIYLMSHYEPGDRIIMFGFSRGAFIARLLAGMLERVGLLSKGLDEMVWMAWKIYEAWEYAAQPVQPSYQTTLVEEFKKTFSRNIDIEIHFQGLFDSVNSCGILIDRLFPYTARSGIVRHIRHAVSIDERRGKFKQQSFSPNPYRPNLFSLTYRNYIVEYKPVIGIGLNRQFRTAKNHFIDHTIGMKPDSAQSNLSMQELITRINTFLENDNSQKRDNFSNQQVEGVFQVHSPHESIPERNISSDLVEKWFPGDHSDTGGSWPPDITEQNHFLSDISLRWILSESVKYGIIFKKGILHEFAAKYTSAGSLLSASHDLLSFKNSHFTMKSPFQDKETTLDKDQINRYHGFRQPAKKRWLPWKSHDEGFFFRTFDLDTSSSSDLELGLAQSSERIKQRPHKLDGSGNVSIFRVIFWWIAELIPIGIRLENENCEWKNVYIPNLGRKRNIPEYGELHWSVYWRLRLVDDYRPKNLPDYANNLIEQYEDIMLPKKKNGKMKKVVARYSIASPIKSFPGKEAEQLLPPDSIDDGCNCEKNNVEKLKKSTEQLLQRWKENDWEDVPDDLEELLIKYPDL